MENPKSEVWKDVLNYEGYYQVSNYGKVQSVNHNICKHPYTRFHKGQLIKIFVDKRNRCSVGLRKDGLLKRFLVARLVLESFVGLCPDGMECCHNDGNSLNNFLSNLRWDTHTSNMQDKVKHGTITCGEKVHTSKLTPHEVIRIRQLYASNMYTTRVLAKMFNIKQSTCWAIIRYKIWKHVLKGE